MHNTYTIRIDIPMQKKLTITVDPDVYVGLQKTIGARKISKFINDLVKPHVTTPDLKESYRALAKNAEREQEALEWSESVLEDWS